MDQDSPLAILLVGQPSLRRQTRLAVLAALEQRIGIAVSDVCGRTGRYVAGDTAANAAEPSRVPLLADFCLVVRRSSRWVSTPRLSGASDTARCH